MAEDQKHEDYVKTVTDARDAREKKARAAAAKERAAELIKQTGNASADPATIKARVQGEDTKKAAKSGK